MEKLRNTWLIHKERFFSCFTNEILHFGHLVSSRVEGGHSTVKGWVEVSTGDIKYTSERLLNAVDNQQTQIDVEIAQDQSRVLTRLGADSFWERVNRKISHHALNLTFKQYKLARAWLAGTKESTIIPDCRSYWRKTHGLPCAHEIYALLRLSTALEVEMFHCHWQLERIQLLRSKISPADGAQESKFLTNLRQHHNQLLSYQQKLFEEQVYTVMDKSKYYLVLDPALSVTRGRPKLDSKRIPKSSTKRNLSKFEHAEKQDSKKQRHCSTCAGAGHYKTTCMNETAASELDQKENIGPYPSSPPGSLQVPPTSLDCSNLIMGIPDFAHFLIKEFINVAGDGNCGFRAVAVCLGLGEDDYMSIRLSLHREVLDRWALYREYFSAFGENYFCELVTGIIPDNKMWDGAGFAPVEFWMQFPAYGAIIATKFQRVVHFFSMADQSTFPPLVGSPDLVKGPPFVIGLYGNHYFALTLMDNTPRPPIFPLWRTHADQEAIAWENVLQPSTSAYMSLAPAKTFDEVILE